MATRGGRPGCSTRWVAWPTSTTTRPTQLISDSAAWQSPEDCDDAWLTAWALHLLGLSAYIAGEYQTAVAYYDRCLVIRRELGHLEGLLIALHLKGVAMYRLGRLAESLQLTREALQVARELNSTWFYTCLLPIFAGLAAENQPQRAARLGGVVTAMSESAQTLPIPITEAYIRREHARRPRETGRGSLRRRLGAGSNAVAGGGAGRGSGRGAAC